MTAHKLALSALAAAGLFVACEELPDDAEPAGASEPSAAVPPQMPPLEGEEALPSPPQLKGPGLFGLGVQFEQPSEGEGIPAEVEDAPERVDWTLSETALRHYVDWQRHLEDAQALSELAMRVAADETAPEALRKGAAAYAEPEGPDASFARFGLSRDEVLHAEQLCQELAFLREPLALPPALPDLRGRVGAAERQFLGALQDHLDRALREASAPLRAQFGDANVDLLLRYQASLPACPQLLADAAEVAEAESAIEGEAPAAPAPAEETPADL